MLSSVQKTKLTPKERMNKAMNLQEPDRVPVMCQMSIGHMLLQTGISPSELWYSGDIFTEGLLELREIYDFDGILISLHGHSPRWKERTRKLQHEEKREIVFWKNGDRTVFPADDLPIHYPQEELRPPVISEFDPESIPEDIDIIPVSQGLMFYLDPSHLYDIFDLLNERAGERYSIHGEVTSPFDYFLHLFGFEETMVNLVKEPSRSKEILQRFTDGVKKIAVGQTHHKVDAIKISSPFAGAGFISPEFYKKFVLPYESQIAQAVRALGVHVYTHTCGAINDRLETMVEAGVSGIECLDPPPLGDVRLNEAKSRVGNQVFIKGNIDPVNVLLSETVETVRKDAEYRIEKGKPGGGFILSTACSIAPHTKRENVQVLFSVASEKGVY
jgi:uroporphyrinogen-III decarboxylase